MTQPDRLYSKEQIEEWASKRADDAGRLSRQLLDTIRENEELKRHPLKLICEKCGVLTDIEPNPSKQLLAVDLDSGTMFTESGVYAPNTTKTP